MPDGRGGYRQPRNPAAVSGPGALSQRTDGGAGSTKQPIRVPSGGRYGERKAATEQQAAAPMATGGPSVPPPPSPGTGAGGVASTPPASGAFGPTQFPTEPNDAGLDSPMSNPLAANPQALLRVMYARFPHPAIARLLDTTSGNRQF